MLGTRFKEQLPKPSEALPGRSTPMIVPASHYVNSHALKPPFPEGMAVIWFGMGCFWGAERKFWNVKNVFSTAVGYCGGYTLNPTYEEVCSGKTGHAEVVQVVYPDSKEMLSELLQMFWEHHDPTQGMRQGNDRGTQYRSVIFTENQSQFEQALQSRDHFQSCLQQAGKGEVTTDIAMATPFYFAEEYHQQYLAKNPGGYCGIGGTGICY